MRRLGITFSVYGDQEGAERIILFDICPRIIVESQWRWIERGLKQRIVGLNQFLEGFMAEVSSLSPVPSSWGCWLGWDCSRRDEQGQ